MQSKQHQLFYNENLLLFCFRMKKNKDEGSECAKCGLKCCICCCYCLENFIRYLNHNAYTVIAIDGVNFCSAAKTVSL